MQSAPDDYTTVSAKEAYAYGHVDYIALIDGLRAAVEVEEKARWALERLKMDVEVWRTMQANDRYMKDKVTF